MFKKVLKLPFTRIISFDQLTQGEIKKILKEKQAVFWKQLSIYKGETVTKTVPIKNALQQAIKARNEFNCFLAGLKKGFERYEHISKKRKMDKSLVRILSPF